METWVSRRHICMQLLTWWSYFQCVISGDGNIEFKESYLEMEMSISRSHLLRWIREFQAAISDWQFRDYWAFSMSHMQRWIRVSQGVISVSHSWNDESFINNNICHIWRWVRGFQVVMSVSHSIDDGAFFKGSSLEIDTWVLCRHLCEPF